MFTSHADAKKYCEDNNTQLMISRSRTTGKGTGTDLYGNEYGYSYKPGEATGLANYANNGQPVCLNTTEKHTIENDVVAYKFKFSTDNLELPRNIYNIFMKGKIGHSYPNFETKNVGIGFIKSKNKLNEKNIFVNYIKNKYGTWIKVGIFKNNAAKSIQNTIKSTHNLSIVMDQNTNSAFSADFGEMESSEVRILGATDYNNWEETRTIDWIYKVPKTALGKYRKWKRFFQLDVRVNLNQWLEVIGVLELMEHMMDEDDGRMIY